MLKKLLFLVVLAFIFNTAHQSLKAQDLCSNNSKYCKLLADTAGVKMMLITLPPGAKLKSHTHPVYEMYVLKGGLYKWTVESTNETMSAPLKPGDAFPGAPETPHHSWNGGKTTIQFILVEKSE